MLIRQYFCILLFLGMAYIAQSNTESDPVPPSIENQSIGIFDGVYGYIETPDGAEFQLLPKDKYDVVYNSEENVYDININFERFGSSIVHLKKEIAGSHSLSAKIIFSTTNNGFYRTWLSFEDPDVPSELMSETTFVRSLGKKRTVHRIGYGEILSYLFDPVPLQQSEREEMYFRLTYFDDFQQLRCEWSEDGIKWHNTLHTIHFEEDYSAFIIVGAWNSPLTHFRLENVAIEPINFVYGKRVVERIDDSSAKVNIELTNPTSNPIQIVVNEVVSGEVQVSNLSHDGKFKEATETISTKRLHWNLAVEPGKSTVEYTIQAINTNISPTVLFNGDVQDRSTFGEEDFTFETNTELDESILHWRSWTVDDGLPQTKVRYIHKAPSGSLYISTFFGRQCLSAINRFDGYKFEPIFQGDFSDVIPKEALDGTLWCYERTQNIDRLHRLIKDVEGSPFWEICRDASGKPYKMTDQLSLSFLHCGYPDMGCNTAKFTFVPIDADRVLTLHYDRLELYNATKQEATVLLKAESTLERFYHMILSQDNQLWVTGKTGVLKVNIDDLSAPVITEQYILPEEIQLRSLNSPIEGKNGLLLDSNVSKFILNKKYYPFDLGINLSSPLALTENNGIWFLGSERYGEEHIAHYQSNETKIVSQPNNRLTHLSTDFASEKDGSFWLASETGLTRYSPPLWRKPLELKSIQSEISMITEDASGNIWGLDRDYLYKYDGNTVSHFSLQFPIWSYKTQSLVWLPDGRLAIQVGELNRSPKPFYIFDPKSETFDMIQHPDDLHCDYIAPGNKHDLLMVMYDEERDAQLDAYKNGEFINLIDSQEKILMGIYHIYECSNGDILIGSDSEEHLQWYRDGIKIHFSREQKYPGSQVLSILEVSEGKIWVGDINNLYEFDGEKWTVLRSGLNNVLSMFKSSDGSIWLATWSGLHRYYHGSWFTHNSEDGFRNNMIHKIFEDNQGRLWAGTADGMYLYHPEADADPPQTYVQEQENRTNYIADEEVRIAFSGIDKWKYTKKERLLYSYRVNKGDWSPFQSDTVATLNNLPPKHYTMEIRAIDRNWNIDPSPVVFEFNVLPPPIQQQAWFLPVVGAVLSIILLLAFIAYWSRLQVREYALNLESIVKKRTKELYQTQKHILSISEHEQQRIGQELHDDVVQELVGIAIHSEFLLKKIQRRDPELAHSLKDILEKVDSATNKTRRLSKGLAPVNLDQLGLLSGIQALCIGTQRFYGINCQLMNDGEPNINDDDIRLNLFRITQEAVHNAIKHANPNKITIHFESNDNFLDITIQDDGIGFEHAPNGGMGLQIMKHRADSIGAHYKIESQKGIGTTVKVQLLLKQN